MTASDKVFAGSVPEMYERHLVPLIFEPYAEHLAERLARIDPRHVLETAAGTGVLTRALAARLPPEARLVATDLNQPDARFRAVPVRSRRSHRMATGRCVGAAVSGRNI